MKILLLTALLAFTLAQAKMTQICIPGEGCTTIITFGDDND